MYQLMINHCWFGFLGSPYERAPLESQTTGPQTNNEPLVECTLDYLFSQSEVWMSSCHPNVHSMVLSRGNQHPWPLGMWKERSLKRRREMVWKVDLTQLEDVWVDCYVRFDACSMFACTLFDPFSCFLGGYRAVYDVTCSSALFLRVIFCTGFRDAVAADGATPRPAQGAWCSVSVIEKKTRSVRAQGITVKRCEEDQTVIIHLHSALQSFTIFTIFSHRLYLRCRSLPSSPSSASLHHMCIYCIYIYISFPPPLLPVLPLLSSRRPLPGIELRFRGANGKARTMKNPGIKKKLPNQ